MAISPRLPCFPVGLLQSAVVARRQPLQSHIIMDEPENFVPPETSGESTSVAAPILDEAEDDVKEGQLSISHEQASGQPVSEWSIFSKNIKNFRNRGRCPRTPAGGPAASTPAGGVAPDPNSNPLHTVLATRLCIVGYMYW